MRCDGRCIKTGFLRWRTTLLPPTSNPRTRRCSCQCFQSLAFPMPANFCWYKRCSGSQQLNSNEQMKRVFRFMIWLFLTLWVIWDPKSPAAAVFPRAPHDFWCAAKRHIFGAYDIFKAYVRCSPSLLPQVVSFLSQSICLGAQGKAV